MKMGPAASRQDKMPPTFGFFVSQMGSYQEAIWNGIVEVAEEYNVNVLCFLGGELNSHIGLRKHWNVIYDLASSTKLDGIIILSSTLQNYVTIEEMSRFCARYAQLPVISIAEELEGIPSITIDNRVGLHELMQHLIEHHHYKRLAFIQGPQNNPEAQARYQAYVDSLEDYGIPFDPDLVAPGTFRTESGTEAVKLFLDQRKVSFEVIVAASDRMAIGAWQELTRRGLSVPNDVAVTGFDDLPEARTFSTPLTTIRQSLAEQGRQAARMLLDYLHHGIPPRNLVIGTETVIRESCGCLPSAATDLMALLPVTTFAPSERESVLADIQKRVCSSFPSVSPQSLERLVDAYFDAVEGKPASQFLPLFSRLLRETTTNLTRIELDQGIMATFQEVLSIFQNNTLPYLRSKEPVVMDRLLHQGRILIAEAAERAQSSLRGRAEANMLIQSEIIRDINAAHSAQRAVDVLAQSLPNLGIGTCAVVLYEGESIPPPFSRLIMAYHNGVKFELEPEGRLFPSVQLIPPDIVPPNELPFLVVCPLVTGNTHFGFILMEMIVGSRAMYNAYEELAEQIGSALHRALLVQQIEQSNESLQQRAAELAEANAQLEQFAYIASHDLQEPLRMVTSYLQLLERRYRDRLDADAQEFIAYAVDGALRMKRMINDLLAYSRAATRGQPLEPTDCEHLLGQVMSNLEIAIKDNDVLITHDPLPTIMADSTQLMGVFQNLIGNAIKFQAGKQPQIHIAAQRIGHEWQFSVRDNGIGIAPENVDRIFDVFSRLHSQAQYPGTGIGLAICKKVVERHGGRIWVESQPGDGTTFFFTIPDQELHESQSNQ